MRCIPGGENRIDFAEDCFHIIQKWGPFEKIQLRTKKRKGHQFLEAEAYWRHILEAGEKTVDLLAIQPFRDKRVARLVNSIQVPKDGAAVDSGLFRHLIDSHSIAGLHETDDVVH